MTMATYTVTIAARKVGAIGSLGTEKRTYTIENCPPDQVNERAIRSAYAEGGLEHVTVVKVLETGRIR